MTGPNFDQYVSVAQEYFRRADAGRADIVDLISRVHIYLDPDHVSEDHPRFLWGLEGRSW
jgi:hypothetical protein